MSIAQKFYKDTRRTLSESGGFETVQEVVGSLEHALNRCDELESLQRESLDLLQTLRGWLMYTRDLTGPEADTLAHDVASIDAHIAELREALGVVK